MVTVFGIGNCDTVRKARRWLDAHGVEYRFHDVRKDGLTRKQLEGWAAALGWEALLNRRGTSWRTLPEAVREHIDRRAALTLMLEQPAIIRRPLLDLDGTLHTGFSEAAYRELFG